MQLSTAPDSTITLIQDLDVEEVMEGLKLLPSSMENAKVIGVLGFEQYPKCLKCSAKLSGTEEFITCEKCGLLQCQSEYESEITAQLMII